MATTDQQMIALLTSMRNLLQQQQNTLVTIVPILKRIEFNSRPALKASVFKFDIFKIANGLETQGEGTNMLLQLGQDARIVVTAIQDSAGNPARVEGDALTWAVVGNTGLGDLTPDADGMGATFVRNGTIGTCQIQVSGDADLGPDVSLILGTVDLDCAGGVAVTFVLDAQAVPHV